MFLIVLIHILNNFASSENEVNSSFKGAEIGLLANTMSPLEQQKLVVSWEIFFAPQCGQSGCFGRMLAAPGLQSNRSRPFFELFL